MWTILLTVVLTLVVVLIAINLHRPEKEIRHQIEHCHDIADPRFRREMGALLGPAIVGGNRIEALQNGDEIFPSMLRAIAAARQSITFETYIYWSGETGTRFAEALIERARAGVHAHVMLDWVGSEKIDRGLVRRMHSAGVEVERYHPLRWYDAARINNRTHRKVLVCDGKIGFTGGVGIADQWKGHAQDPNHWRDMHFRVEGPVVGQMQAAFLDNWIKTTGNVLHGDAYFPDLEEVGDSDMQLFISSPAGGSTSMRLMYLTAITAAAHSIDIAAAYFIPDRLMTEELIKAARRHVRVRVLVPDRYTDSEVVRIMAKREWGGLLSSGVEIYCYEPTMLHTKMLIFDQFMVSVGSTNFDTRSFELNDEASLNVYDREFARKMTAGFEADLQRSRSYSLEAWRQRGWRERAAELVLLPIRGQL
ncbi:MAG TPA: phospholipase D-like domain-containing protein [Steroidobacteraceae bacterium]|nr:phospholipase D-like domain-containing protein [Steroidobacteraceae bacterium]